MIIVKIGCKPINTKTNPSESVVEIAFEKHHDPPTPPKSIMPIMDFMFFIFLIFSRRKYQRKRRRIVPARLVSMAIKRFQLRGLDWRTYQSIPQILDANMM